MQGIDVSEGLFADLAEALDLGRELAARGLEVSLHQVLLPQWSIIHLQLQYHWRRRHVLISTPLLLSLDNKTLSVRLKFLFAVA